MSHRRPTWIVARTLRGLGTPRWELVSAGDNKPTPEIMRQYRQFRRNYRFKCFSEEQWEALPYGHQDRDWVTVDNISTPREPDGIRRR